jgi:hypothetical protein
VCARVRVCVCVSLQRLAWDGKVKGSRKSKADAAAQKMVQASRQASWEGIGNFLRDIDREGGLLTRSSSATGAGSSL